MNEFKPASQNGADHNIQIYRKIIQYLFLAVIVLIGVQFALFVNQLEEGLLPTIARPPGIEG
ncbi:MAG: hypothetical protein PVG96_10695, partial [Desulfobacterales bacterium]